jgi:transcriptional regulator with XRE-family HTH domain
MPGAAVLEPRRTKPYTLNEVAEMFNVTPQTIGNWLRAGKFPKLLGMGAGRRKLWSAEVIEAVASGKWKASR